MRCARQKWGMLLAVGGLLAGLAGCGGSDAVTAGTGEGNLSGRIFAPDGATALAGVLVYAPTAQAARQAPEPVLASDLTDENGDFTLNGLPLGNVVIKFLKGSFTKTLTVEVGPNTMLTTEQGTLPASSAGGSARIAVVTGHYDRMQDVLAKLGFGTVDAGGHLELGTESFALYDGDNSLPEPYPSFATLVGSVDELRKHDIIFLNCGVDEYNDVTRVEPGSAGVVANLQTYVTQGGSLYVTDLAYDFVEQAFPSAINFEGSDATAADVPEELDAAQVGDAGITSDATVLDSTLQAWLQARGALNSNGTVHIAGFLSGWAVMESVAAGTKVWAEGPVTFTDVAARAHRASTGGSRATAIRPLTVTFPSGQGRVLFSSYHTEEEEGAATLRPQEQILAYLVFEL